MPFLATHEVGHDVPALSAAHIESGPLARFFAVAAGRPGWPAVVDADGVTTFAELAARSCAWAETLRRQVPEGQPVTMVCGHDAGAVGMMLGMMLSGRPLLVMDSLVPVPRLQGFVKRLGARVCLTDPAREAIARQVMAGTGGDALLGAPARPCTGWQDSAIWREPPDPASVAALGFTSGSTGRPKVVALNHRHLIGDAWAGASATDCVRAEDVLAHTLPLGFAAGMNVTLMGLLTGATMALYDTRARGIAGLAGWIEQAGVTVATASPAILRAFVATGPDPARLAGLRSLTLSGEAAHGRDVAAARALLPEGCTVFHRFGSTETGLVAEYRLGPGDPTPEGPLPVGELYPGTQVDLVGDDGSPVAPGEPGVLQVTRSYLASGYWQDPERTAEAFTGTPDGRHSFRGRDLGRWEAPGRLRLLGRRDHSVKIRGYMVEPGEVDAVLFGLPEIREAVTVGRPRAADGVLQLVAYVVPAVERLSAAAVRTRLHEQLPSYMVPQTVVQLPALPRTERGKIDRAALPEPPATVTGSSGQDTSSWERLIADVIKKALVIEDIGPDDDFFELGGDSLAAEAVVAALVSDLGVPADRVGTALLVRSPTVRALAADLSGVVRTHDVMVPVQPEGTRRPLFVVAGGGGLGASFVWLARHLGADQPVWALQARGLEHRALPDRSVRAIARRDVTALRRVQPHGPYRLAGHSFGGVVALDVAQRLRRAGEEVELLVLLDSYPPVPGLPPRVAAPSLAARLKDRIGLLLTGLRRPGPAHVYWQFYRFSGALQRRYRGRPWAGRTLVLVAADGDDKERRSHWAGHLVGPWQLLTVPGDHVSMTREPFVEQTARAIADEIARLDSA